MKKFKILSILFCLFLLIGNNYSEAITCKKVEKQLCNSKGNNCWVSARYEYDNLGNQIEYYSPFKNNFSQKLDNYSLHTFVMGPKYRTRTITDKYENKIVSYTCNAADFSDCKKYDYTKINKYIYDERGNILQETISCGYGNPAIHKYTYNKNNKVIMSSKKSCASTSNPYIQKYEYDSNGNKTAEYVCTDETLSNCKQVAEFKYDKNNNIILDRHDCRNNMKTCLFEFKYEYITMANGNKYKKIFTKSGKTGELYCMDQDEYDGRGNLLRENINCPENTERGVAVPYRYEYDLNNNLTASYECKYDKKTDRYEQFCSQLLQRKKYDNYGNLIEWYHDNGFSTKNYVIEKYKYECK